MPVAPGAAGFAVHQTSDGSGSVGGYAATAASTFRNLLDRPISAAVQDCPRGGYFWVKAFIHWVETDFGLVMAVPMARLRINWASIPWARDTENNTV